MSECEKLLSEVETATSNTERSYTMESPFVKAGMWLAPMVIGVLLWGGSISQTVAALATDVKQHAGEIVTLSKVYERTDERLKGMERTLDRIEKTVSK